MFVWNRVPVSTSRKSRIFSRSRKQVHVKRRAAAERAAEVEAEGAQPDQVRRHALPFAYEGAHPLARAGGTSIRPSGFHGEHEGIRVRGRRQVVVPLVDRRELVVRQVLREFFDAAMQ
jgi:hypothetical protein